MVENMHPNNPKILALLLCFFFSMSIFTGSAAALNCNFNAGNDIQSINIHNSYDNPNLNYDSDYTGNSFKNWMVLKEVHAKKSNNHPHSQLFKKQKQGMENLRIISSGGIPPKGLDEIVADNIVQIKSMVKTVKNKINPIFSKFNKKTK